MLSGTMPSALKSGRHGALYIDTAHKKIILEIYLVLVYNI